MTPLWNKQIAGHYPPLRCSICDIEFPGKLGKKAGMIDVKQDKQKTIRKLNKKQSDALSLLDIVSLDNLDGTVDPPNLRSLMTSMKYAIERPGSRTQVFYDYVVSEIANASDCIHRILCSLPELERCLHRESVQRNKKSKIKVKRKSYVNGYPSVVNITRKKAAKTKVRK